MTSATPRHPTEGQHWQQALAGHPRAWPITRALIERAKVIPDFRGPDAIRFGLPPLYTSFGEVHEGMTRLRSLVERGVQREMDAAPGRIT
jgi:kynureninase